MKKPLVISLAAAVIVVAVGIYFIIQSQRKSADPVVTNPVDQPVQQAIKFADGRQCYTYSHEATKEEPVTSTEFIDMTIAGTTVTGTKHGTQSGPELTNGWEGTLNGSITGDTMTVAFAYTVEGSKNTEQEIYQASLAGIDRLRYPLIDKYKDGLFPDTTKDFTRISYKKIDCESFDDQTIVENYLRNNIAILAPKKAVLGGTWQVVSVAITPEAKTGSVIYEDGHVQEKSAFSYVRDGGRVTITWVK